MKVFLDANILFSASDPGSATRTLFLKLLETGQAVTSFHAVEEAKRNLELKRPQFLEGLSDIVEKTIITRAFALVKIEGLPEQDVPILAAAVGERCTHLWTSDKRHFGGLYGESINGVKVVSSLGLYEELES